MTAEEIIAYKFFGIVGAIVFIMAPTVVYIRSPRCVICDKKILLANPVVDNVFCHFGVCTRKYTKYASIFNYSQIPYIVTCRLIGPIGINYLFHVQNQTKNKPDTKSKKVKSKLKFYQYMVIIPISYLDTISFLCLINNIKKQSWHLKKQRKKLRRLAFEFALTTGPIVLCEMIALQSFYKRNQTKKFEKKTRKRKKEKIKLEPSG